MRYTKYVNSYLWAAKLWVVLIFLFVLSLLKFSTMIICYFYNQGNLACLKLGVIINS